MVNIIILNLILIGVQNANKKNSIKFLTYETIEMPVGFILGISFLFGVSTGSSLLLIKRNTNNT